MRIIRMVKFIAAVLLLALLAAAFTGCLFTKGKGAGYDSYGRFSFDMRNNTAVDIYSVHIGLKNADAETDIDLLPGLIRIGETKTASEAIKDDSLWGITEWTIYITDTEGKKSIDYEIFNPWTVKLVDIYWDEAAGGYKCGFTY